MHEAYWKLRESPFQSGCEGNYFYASPTHEEALARMHFLVEQRRPLGILSGAGGTGKSATLAVFGTELPAVRFRVCRRNLTGLDTRSLLWTFAAALHTNPGLEDDAFQLWRYIDDAIGQNGIEGVTTVFLLDDADYASTDAILPIQRLVKVFPGKVSILLATETATNKRLSGLANLVDLHIRLDRWDEFDSAEFIRQSLRKAGCDKAIFDDLALARIHELSGGVPRSLCQLAELALIAGAGQERKRIDWNTIEAVHEELAANQSDDASNSLLRNSISD